MRSPRTPGARLKSFCATSPQRSTNSSLKPNRSNPTNGCNVQLVKLLRRGGGVTENLTMTMRWALAREAGPRTLIFKHYAQGHQLLRETPDSFFVRLSGRSNGISRAETLERPFFKVGRRTQSRSLRRARQGRCSYIGHSRPGLLMTLDGNACGLTVAPRRWHVRFQKDMTGKSQPAGPMPAHAPSQPRPSRWHPRRVRW